MFQDVTGVTLSPGGDSILTTSLSITEVTGAFPPVPEIQASVEIIPEPFSQIDLSVTDGDDVQYESLNFDWSSGIFSNDVLTFFAEDMSVGTHQVDIEMEEPNGLTVVQ